MQIQVSTRHGQLSEASQEKISAKAEKLTRIFDRLTAISVVVDLADESNPKVELKVAAEHKHDFVAHEQAENLHAALDACVQKIEQQLKKYKERVQDKHRNPDVRRPAEVAGGAVEEDAGESEL